MDDHTLRTPSRATRAIGMHARRMRVAVTPRTAVAVDAAATANAAAVTGTATTNAARKVTANHATASGANTAAVARVGETVAAETTAKTKPNRPTPAGDPAAERKTVAK